MKIEPLVPRDLESIHRLQPSGWQDITSWISYYTKSPFCFPIKVKIQNEVAGIGCGILHHDVAWIAHIIVHPDHRNKGLGTLITKSVVESMIAKGCKTLNLVATDLGAPVYSKLGFHTESEYVFFKDVKPYHDQPDENIKPYQAHYDQEINSLDKLASAEERAFQRASHLANGFVYVEGSKLTGFYLPTLGDGCIFASTRNAGESLMKFRFHEKDHACFPKENKPALKLMYESGYKETRVAKRMRLGPAIAWKPDMMYNRIAGNMG
jgi:GNAT superfamily N-acetyltransferase